METSRLVPEPPSRLSSASQKQKQKQQKDEGSPTGSSLSILVLLVPLVGGVWAGQQEYHAVVEPGRAVATAIGATVALYAVVWLLSFWRTNKDRSLLLVTAFTLLLWLVVGVFVAGRVNSALDGSSGEAFEAEVLSTDLDGPGQKARCVLHLKSDIERVGLDESYCEIVDVGDVYAADLHPGALGVRWLGPPTIRKRSHAP